MLPTGNWKKIKIRGLGTSGRNCLAHSGVCFKSPPVQELVIEDKAVHIFGFTWTVAGNHFDKMSSFLTCGLYHADIAAACVLCTLQSNILKGKNYKR